MRGTPIIAGTWPFFVFPFFESVEPVVGIPDC